MKRIFILSKIIFIFFNSKIKMMTININNNLLYLTKINNNS